MKKEAIIAFIALATSIVVYASVGINNLAEKVKMACCDKSKCCPDGTDTENCCEKLCD